MIEHPGQFHHAPELDFTPAPAHVRTAQGVDQICRFAAKLVLHIQQPAHLFGETLVGSGAGGFQGVDLVVHLVE